MQLKKLWVCCLLGMGAVQLGLSEDLLQTYQLAVKNDPNLLAAQETYAAAREDIPLAWADLLPNLTLTGSSAVNHEQGEEGNYNTNGYQLSLTQPILQLSAIQGFSSAKISVKQAAAQFALAQQNEILTVATDYFNVLEAQDKLSYAQQYLTQLNQQLTQTQAMFKVGLKANTDVQTTEASQQSAVANVSAAQSQLDSAKAVLMSVTGQDIKHLYTLSSNFPLSKPSPESEDAWVRAAMQHNLSVQTAAFQVDLAKNNVIIAQEGTPSTPGYAPSVGLTATDNYGMDHSSPPASRSYALSLDAKWNVYNGGQTLATVRQTQDQYHAAQASLEDTQRTVSSQVKQAYLSVESDIAQVHAYQQAVRSNQVSLTASRAAYQAGTITIVDLLTQESNLLQAEQQYTAALYQYITDSLTLKQLAGTLSESDLAAINTHLQPKA